MTIKPKTIATPSVYRPNPVPRVLQAKTAVAPQQITPQKRAAAAAPRVYRPQPVPRVLQAKTVEKRVVPPPVNRPVVPKVLQTKPVVANVRVTANPVRDIRRPPVSAPVFRPQPIAPAVQAKFPPHRQSSATAVSSKQSLPNRVVQRGITLCGRAVIQRAMAAPAADPVLEGAEISMARLRRDLGDWVKAEYFEDKGHVDRGASVDAENTIVASGFLKWFGEGKKRVERFSAVPSGNPMHRVKNVNKIVGSTKQGNIYRQEPLRFHQEGEIGGSRRDKGEHGNCAEQKILLMAEYALGRIRYWREEDEDEDTDPYLTIVSEKTPCSVCEQKILAFRAAHPDVTILVKAGQRYEGNFASTWQYGGAPGSLQLGFPATQDSPISGSRVPKPEEKKESKKGNNPFALLREGH